jgi:protein TonB
VRYHPVIMIGGNSVLMGVPRRWGVLTSVVLVHLAVLWWLQQGLSRAVLPMITPVTLISVPLDKPTPLVLPEPTPVPVRPAPALAPRQQSIPDKPPPPATPAPVNSATPAAPPANVPATVTPAPEAAAPASTGMAASPPPVTTRAGTAGVASAGVVLPSAYAAYLHNPPPAYPALSRRLAEQGRVMVRVLIGADGVPQKAELQAASGYDRLDRAAMDAVMRWRFVPGRRGDVPEPMWVSVPIVFNLE